MEDNKKIHIVVIGHGGVGKETLYQEALDKIKSIINGSSEVAEKAIEELLEMTERLNPDKSSESLRETLKNIQKMKYRMFEVQELAKMFPYSYEEVCSCYIENGEDIQKTKDELIKRTARIFNCDYSIKIACLGYIPQYQSNDLLRKLIEVAEEMKIIIQEEPKIDKFELLANELDTNKEFINISKRQKETKTWNKKKFYE